LSAIGVIDRSCRWNQSSDI